MSARILRRSGLRLRPAARMHSVPLARIEHVYQGNTGVSAT